MSSVSSFFATELRRARQAAGLSQEQLGTATNYSGSYVAQMETERKPPKPDFVKRADDVLATGGLLARILEELLLKEVTPEWLKPWFIIEQSATALRAYNPLVVYGLLQTEDYARELLTSDDPDRTDSRVAARMERQQLLARDKPPSVVVLLDEAVLRRRVGSAEVMHEQLQHLTTVRASVQIVPQDAQTYLGLAGSFEIASYDGREVAYLDAPDHGFVIDSAEILSRLKERWEILRAEALPLRQSRRLILEVAETWKS